MRSSAHKTDPGYATFIEGAPILVDGVAVQACFTADEELGEVWCYVRAEGGGYELAPGGRSLLRLCRRGRVEIVVPAGVKKPRRRTFVRMFKPRFAPLVESGTKLHTVRPTPDRLPRVGDIISLRTWLGKPYRSKQRELRLSMITDVRAIMVDHEGVSVTGLGPTDPDTFARADGFADFSEMREWFTAEHGLPFQGICIYWQ